MWKKCKVVMLATDKKADLIIGKTKVLFFNNSESAFRSIRSIQDAVYQHLYILSDDEIKEGDWFVNRQYFIEKDNKPEYEVWQCDRNFINSDDCKKIIATTDISIKYINADDSGLINLCSIPKSFIDKYVSEYNKGNKIEEVIVEYTDYIQCKGNMEWYTDEQRQDDNGIDSYYNCNICGDIRKNVIGNMSGKRICGKQSKINILKLNPDNTINIKSIKDSWNYIDLLKAVREAIVNPDTFCTGIVFDNNKFDNWIESNL